MVRSAGGQPRWWSSSGVISPIRKAPSGIWVWSRVSRRSAMSRKYEQDSLSLPHRNARPPDRDSAQTVVPIRRRGDISALFRSFWIGGFESASHINQSGCRINMLSATQHEELADPAYARLTEWGIQTV